MSEYKDHFVRKNVSFNIADPDQKALLEYAMQRPNFSAYVKRLIQRDMEGWNPIAGTSGVMRVAPEINKPKEEDKRERLLENIEDML
jgi:hypothetical protein